MAYINQPPDLRIIFSDLDDRLRKLETAVRFTSPYVAADPSNPRAGDLWYNNVSNLLKLYTGAATRVIAVLQVAQTWTALQTFSQGISVANGATITSGDLSVSAGNVNVTVGNVSATGSGASITSQKLIATTNGVEVQAGGVGITAGGLTVTAGGATITAGGLSVNGGTTAVGAFNFSTTTTSTTVGAAGGATALPATPLGYVTVAIAGTDRKIPYYNT